MRLNVHHERRDSVKSHHQSGERAAQRADSKAQQAAADQSSGASIRSAQIELDGHSAGHAAQSHDAAHAEINPGGDDDHRHADRHDRNLGVAVDDVDEILPRQENGPCVTARSINESFFQPRTLDSQLREPVWLQESPACRCIVGCDDINPRTAHELDVLTRIGRRLGIDLRDDLGLMFPQTLNQRRRVLLVLGRTPRNDEHRWRALRVLRNGVSDLARGVRRIRKMFLQRRHAVVNTQPEQDEYGSVFRKEIFHATFIEFDRELPDGEVHNHFLSCR